MFSSRADPPGDPIPPPPPRRFFPPKNIMAQFFLFSVNRSRVSFLLLFFRPSSPGIKTPLSPPFVFLSYSYFRNAFFAPPSPPGFLIADRFRQSDTCSFLASPLQLWLISLFYSSPPQTPQSHWPRFQFSSCRAFSPFSSLLRSFPFSAILPQNGLLVFSFSVLPSPLKFLSDCLYRFPSFVSCLLKTLPSFSPPAQPPPPLKRLRALPAAFSFLSSAPSRIFSCPFTPPRFRGILPPPPECPSTNISFSRLVFALSPRCSFFFRRPGRVWLSSLVL